MRGYKREWLDQLTLSGEVTWGRLWGAGLAVPRRTPDHASCLRQDLESWTAWPPATVRPELRAEAQAVLDALAARGAMFAQELARAGAPARRRPSRSRWARWSRWAASPAIPTAACAGCSCPPRGAAPRT